MNPEEYHLMYQIEDSYWWYQGMREITFTLIGDFLADGKGLRLLDAGCGTGGMMQSLSKFGSVVGIDFSEEATTLSRTRQCGPILRGSVTDLPFADSTFDLVTCFDVIYHLKVSDDSAALREMGRVLRPGGQLLIRVPAYDFLRGHHDLAVHTRHRYSLKELRAKIEDAGLKPIKGTYANTLLFPAAGAKRLWETILPAQSKTQSDLKPMSGILNKTLRSALTMESWLIKKASMPFGLSAICLATKEL